MSIAREEVRATGGRWAELEARRGARLAVVTLVALAAVAVRMPGALGGLWRDEVQSQLVSAIPSLRGMLSFLIETESHPPLYYLMLRGLGPNAPDWLLTLPSLVFSAALVFAVYYAGRRMFGLRSGVWAALVAALFPVLVAYGSAARPYALLALLNLLAVYVAWEAFEQRRTSMWLLYGALATLLLYTHTWALILVAAQGLALLGLAVVRRAVRATLSGAVKAVSVVLILWGPWIPALLRQIDQGGHGRLYLPLGELLTRWATVSLGGVASLGWGASGVVTWLVPDPVRLLVGALWLGLIGYFVYQGLRATMEAERHQGNAAFLLAGTVLAATAIALALTPVSNVLVLHPVTALAPLAAVLIGRGLEAARAPVVTWSFLVALLLGGCMEVWPRSNARATAEVLATREPADAELLVVPGSYLSSLARYDRSLASRPPRTFPSHQVGQPVNYRDRWSRFADTVSFAAYTDEAVSALGEGREVWLVTGPSILATDSLKGAPKQGDFDIVAIRIHELDQRLAAVAGTVDTLRTGFGRIENYLVVQYAPPDSDRAPARSTDTSDAHAVATTGLGAAPSSEGGE